MGLDSAQKRPLKPGGSTRETFTGQEPAIWRKLSEKQQQLARLIAHGYTHSQIAEKKACSKRYVEECAKTIANELRAPGRKQRERVTQIWHGRKAPE